MRFPPLAHLLLVSLSAVLALAQNPSPAPSTTRREPSAGLISIVRDPQAIQMAQRALSAMGGESRIAQIHDCVIEANADVSEDGRVSNIVYKLSGQELRIDSARSDGNQSILSGHGHPVLFAHGSSKRLPTHIVRSLFAPPAVALVLLQVLRDDAYSFRYKGTETEGETQVFIVQTRSEREWPDPVVTPQTWYFDTNSGLPVRLDYRLPDARNPKGFLKGSVSFSEYRAESGVLFPLKYTTTVNNTPPKSGTVTTVQLNVGISPSVFDSQAGGVQ